jgi:hypothetical protein
LADSTSELGKISTEMLEYIFGHVIVALAVGGLVVNCCALVAIL